MSLLFQTRRHLSSLTKPDKAFSSSNKPTSHPTSDSSNVNSGGMSMSNTTPLKEDLCQGKEGLDDNAM
jgi:hypothetical protein